MNPDETVALTDAEKILARRLVDDLLQDTHERANNSMCEMAGAVCAMDNVRLHCNACGREETLVIEAALRYLESGWPRCCGAHTSIRTGYGEN